MSRFDPFLQTCASRLPGTLVHCNIPDFKRYNTHLGHLAGDRVIAAFQDAIGSAVDPPGVWMYAGGGCWFAFVPDPALAALERCICDFEQVTPITAGWALVAERNGEHRRIQHTIPARIVRAVRALAVQVTTDRELAPALASLDRNNHRLPPSRLIALAEADALRVSWTCVSDYPTQNPYCAFCRGESFTWLDGDGSIYGADGLCTTCGASVSISDAEPSLTSP